MKWTGLSISSTFPPSSRPIYIHPVSLMSRRNRDHAYPQVAEAIGKILENKQGKVLVHTVSYDLNLYLLDRIRNQAINVFSYSSSSEKQRAIDRYLYEDTAVLFAPSLERGIDLPQDECRQIIVCKLPFPNLATKQISARLHSRGGQLWYNVRTVRSLVQMTGRGMRSADDYCSSYILDKQFITIIWKRSKHLLPEWWKEALVWNAGTL